MSASVYVAIPVMLLLGIMQTTIIGRFPMFGQIPQLPLLIALVWSIIRDVNTGLIWAFIAGLCLDLFSITPLGSTSIAFMAALLAVSWIPRVLPGNSFSMPMVLAALATLVYLFTQTLLLSLTGYGLDWASLAVRLPTILLHAILVLPIYWFTSFIDRTTRTRRVELQS